MKKFLLSVFAITSMAAAAQATFTVGDLTYTVTGANRAQVSDCAEKVTSVEVPSTVENDGKTYTVTSIGPSAFKWTDAASVVLPATIDSIYESAFDSSDLASINIPDGVTYIGRYAFSSCKLTSFTAPKGLKEIANSTFFTCRSLATVTLNDGLKKIGNSAFYRCALTDVVIPASCDTIDKTAFLYCTALTKATLNEGIKYMGDGAFSYCSSLESITLPSTLEGMGIEMFLNDAKLTSLHIPAAVKTIGESLIARTAVSSITVDPANQNFVVTNGALYNTAHSILYAVPMRGVTSFTVDSRCQVVNGGAFWGSEVASVTLPDGVLALGDYTFCQSSLSSVNLPSSIIWLGEQTFASTSITSISLPENFPYINDGELAGCEKLTQVTIPSSVREIYNHAFYNCKGMTIKSMATTPPAIMDYYDEYDHPFYNASGTLQVPKGCKDAYSRAGGYGDLNIVEGDYGMIGVTKVSPADSTTLQPGKSQPLSFQIEFDQEVSLATASPKAYLRIGNETGASTIEPESGWTARLGSDKRTLTVFGADYDGYTESFTPEAETAYYFILSEGTVKNDAGDVNEHLVLYFPTAQTGGVDGINASSNASEAQRYNLAGQRISREQQGINIVRMTDGTVRKLIVR